MPITETPAQVLDCKGLQCPLPVIKTAQMIKTIEPGQVLELLATDPGVEPDMKAWSSRTGNELLAIDREGDVFHVFLRRSGEASVTVELTIDFEHDAQKQAVAFPGPGEPALGYSCQRVDGIDVWWRQRLVLATREPKVTDAIRPRRLLVDRVGRALAARADYA